MRPMQLQAHTGQSLSLGPSTTHSGTCSLDMAVERKLAAAEAPPACRSGPDIIPLQLPLPGCLSRPVFPCEIWLPLPARHWHSPSLLSTRLSEPEASELIQGPVTAG
jgi:hypothetical protein